MALLVQPRPVPAQPDPRVRIVAAASAVFLRDGFAGASIDAIAAAARMSKFSIYEVYPNKAALFEAAVRNACDQSVGEPVITAGETSLEDCLHRFGRSMFERYLDPVNFGLFRANIEAANQFPELAAMLHEHRRQAGQGAAQQLAPWLGLERGPVASAFDLATRFSALCVEGSRYFLGTPAPDAAERGRIVDRVSALMVDGYRPAVGSEVGIDAGPPPVPAVATRMAADRFDRLLAAATNEFLTHGFKGASVDRIVAVIKAGRSTIYRHFGSKEGLFRYVVAGLVGREIASDYTVDGQGAGLESDIVALVRQALGRQCEWGNIKLHRLLIQEAMLTPDLARQFYDGRVRCLGRALSEVLGRHGLPAPAEAGMRDFYNLATSAARYLTVATLPDAGQQNAEAEEIARIYLHGIRG